MEYLNAQGETIYLKATPEVLYKHLQMGKTVRPLLRDKTPEETRDFINSQLAHREPFYNKAHHTLDVNLLDSYEKFNVSVNRIREALHL